MLTCAGTYAEITGEWVRRTGLLDGVGHLHLCSYFLLAAVRPSWEETLPWLRKKGVTVSLDTNWDPAEEWDGLEALWPHVDVFLPNAQEALAISRETTVAAAALYFEKHLPLTVIKDGADGAWLCRGGDPEHFPVPPDLLAEAPVVDTTGAGDSFDAGFMTAWLDGASPADCMARALRCGTRSTQRMGGLKGQWIPGRPDEATDRHARDGD
jgi:sugar/nucleoside kinase (ribokinase family)